uniref:Uncharacterized protein n=1 Tax=Daucus carota subsp. sativus TaxID=79200 RepID=A0A166JF95_DAUCS
MGKVLNLTTTPLELGEKSPCKLHDSWEVGDAYIMCEWRTHSLCEFILTTILLLSEVNL